MKSLLTHSVERTPVASFFHFQRQLCTRCRALFDLLHVTFGFGGGDGIEIRTPRICCQCDGLQRSTLLHLFEALTLDFYAHRHSQQTQEIKSDGALDFDIAAGQS